MRQQAEMRLGEAAGSSNEAETTDGIALFVRVCSASPPTHLVRPRVRGRGVPLRLRFALACWGVGV